MPTYYVLSDIGMYEPSVREFDALDAALEWYKDKLSFGHNDVVICQQLDVRLVATDLDGNEATVTGAGQ